MVRRKDRSLCFCPCWFDCIHNAACSCDCRSNQQWFLIAMPETVEPSFCRSANSGTRFTSLPSNSILSLPESNEQCHEHRSHPNSALAREIRPCESAPTPRRSPAQRPHTELRASAAGAQVANRWRHAKGFRLFEAFDNGRPVPNSEVGPPPSAA